MHKSWIKNSNESVKAGRWAVNVPVQRFVAASQRREELTMGITAPNASITNFRSFLRNMLRQLREDATLECRVLVNPTDNSGGRKSPEELGCYRGSSGGQYGLAFFLPYLTLPSPDQGTEPQLRYDLSQFGFPPIPYTATFVCGPDAKDRAVFEKFQGMFGDERYATVNWAHKATHLEKGFFEKSSNVEPSDDNA